MYYELEVPSPSSEMLTLGYQVCPGAVSWGPWLWGDSAWVPGEAASPPELMEGFTNILPWIWKTFIKLRICKMLGYWLHFISRKPMTSWRLMWKPRFMKNWSSVTSIWERLEWRLLGEWKAGKPKVAVIKRENIWRVEDWDAVEHLNSLAWSLFLIKSQASLWIWVLCLTCN